MIGLRDRYTTRTRGEAWLLLGDAISSGSAILLASGAIPPRSTLTDAALVVLWAVLPRALGRALDPVLRQPRGLGRNIIVAASVGITLLALVAIGLTLLEGIATEGLARSARSWWMMVILAAWGSGFLLFLPRVYLLHDLFLGGLIVLSLALHREGAALLVPLFFIGIGISGAVRHQLHDVFSEVIRPRVNVHNARRLALFLGLVGTATFLGGSTGASLLFPRIGLEPAKPIEVYRPGVRGDWSDSSPSNPTTGFSPAARSEGPEESPSEAGEIPSNSRVGFSRRVQLGALSRPQSDPRVVLEVQEFDARGYRSRPTLRRGALWRGLTLATFDGRGESWEEEVLVAGSTPWVDRVLGFASEGPRNTDPDRLLEVTIVNAVMPTLPVPYFPKRMNPPEGMAGEFRQNLAGDIFPEGGVPVGAKYAVRIAPHPTDRTAWPTRPITGQHSDPRYNQIPDSDDLGFDLVLHAQPIFFGARTIQDRITRLREHFAAEFEYDIQAHWVPVTGRLREFCLREKVGNCEYFATAAAMLLRGGGVSTRVVAGFLGWEWDRDRGVYLIRNGTAHLWTEVYFPGYGWFPIDATAWVPGFDPDVNPNGDSASSPEMTAVGGSTRSEEGSAGERTGSDERSDSDSVGDRRSRDELSRELARREESVEANRIDETSRSTPDFPPPAAWIEIGRPADEGLSPRERTEERDEPWWSDRKKDRNPEADRRFTETVSKLARTGLLAIALAIGLIVAISFLRPARVKDEADEEDPHHPKGGIPDPLAGLATMANDFTPRNHREQIVCDYHRLQRELADRRRHRRPAETPVEHGVRIAKRVPSVDEDATRLAAIVYAALYGRGDCVEEDALEVRRLCQRIKGRLR